MTDPNILTPEWEHDRGTVRGTRVGAAAGASALGAHLFELEPGAQAAPYHMHHGNEELLIVLEGAPELRTPDGTRTLEPGSVVAFPAGASGAHRLRAGSERCRYVIMSTMRYPDVAIHVDTGTVLALTEEGDGYVFPADAEGDFAELFELAHAAER
jgi:uncharacterized cupin superfamily protein